MFKQNAISEKSIPKYHVSSKFRRAGRKCLYYTLYTTQVNVHSCFVWLTITFKIFLVLFSLVFIFCSVLGYNCSLFSFETHTIIYINVEVVTPCLKKI